MLVEYINNSEHFREEEEEPPNVFEKLLNAHIKKDRQISHDDPSFINYKTTEHEREKIYKMVSASSQQITPTSTRKVRVRTEQKLVQKCKSCSTQRQPNTPRNSPT